MITRGLVRDWLVTTVIQNATAALLRVSGLAMKLPQRSTAAATAPDLGVTN